MNLIESVNEQVRLNRLESKISEAKRKVQNKLDFLHVPIRLMAGKTIKTVRYLPGPAVLLVYTDGGWTCLKQDTEYDSTEISDYSLDIYDAQLFDILSKDVFAPLENATKILETVELSKKLRDQLLEAVNAIGVEAAKDILNEV